LHDRSEDLDLVQRSVALIYGHQAAHDTPLHVRTA
jgi:hypothetical protein